MTMSPATFLLTMCVRMPHQQTWQLPALHRVSALRAVPAERLAAETAIVLAAVEAELATSDEGEP